MSLTPLSGVSIQRDDVSPSEFDQGCILFLKKREHVLHTHWRSSGVEEGGLRHPALVIRKDGPQSDQITICIVRKP